MKIEKNPSNAIKKPQKRGRKKWLNKDLIFKVDPKNSIFFPKGKTTKLIPLVKWRKKKPVKIIYCDRNGNGLLKSSKIDFSRRIRA